MPVESALRRFVQEPDFASLGLHIALCILGLAPLHQTNVLPAASSLFHLATDALAVPLRLALGGCAETSYLQRSVARGAQQKIGPRRTADLD